MTLQTVQKLNQLERNLPEGLVVDSAWLDARGYYPQLRRHYVGSGWLKQPARRVYQRPRGTLSWQQIMISLQTLLKHDLVVAGLTALEQQGFAHYLRTETKLVYLSGPKKPPTWLKDLLPGVQFAYRNDTRLFRTLQASTAPHELEPGESQATSAGIVTQPWGQWSWPLFMSSPERAILELLNELPERESFHQVDMVMEGLSTLSPTRMNLLLADCKNVKVKRLFFFFADRHSHAWLKRLDRKNIDLGTGKRMIAKGGRLDTKYQITVPGDLDGLQ